MPEIRTVTTLKRKRAQIAASIKLYERQIAQAQADLAHVNATIRVFEASGTRKDLPRHVDVYRLWKRGETWAFCKACLEREGRLTTRDLAERLATAKGMNAGDKVLIKGIASRLIHSLRMQEQRGRLQRDGKRLGVMIWRLP